MARYCFYIDGFNAYYALRAKPEYTKLKWLNYRKLAQSVIQAQDTITGVFYFTAFVRWKRDSMARHKEYIRALRSARIGIVQGRFMKKDIQCHKCHQFFRTHEEKQSDVNIALQLLGDAVDDLYDKALVISADSDLLPAIKAVERHAPEKEVGVMFPIGHNSYDLSQNAAFRWKMSTELLRNCQFPDEIPIGSETVKRPETWR